VFSYFANAVLTFKPKNRNKTQFAIVMGVFVARLLVSDGLTVGFDYILQSWMHLDYDLNKFYSLIPTFTASVILIPIAYFALAFVFRKTDKADIR
jgi:putative flippase GtrA